MPVAVKSSVKQRAQDIRGAKNAVPKTSVETVTPSKVQKKSPKAELSAKATSAKKSDDDMVIIEHIEPTTPAKPRRRPSAKPSAPLMASPAKYVAPPKKVAPPSKDEIIEPAGLTAPVLPKSGKITARYSDSDLQMFKRHIEASRKKEYDEYLILREQLDDVTSSELADENASYSMHMAEQGTDAQEKEKIYAQVQRKIEYIKKLDEALQRIKEKTYGICKMCGCLINKERLLMVPITTLSVSYKIHSKCPEDGIDRITARTK